MGPDTDFIIVLTTFPVDGDAEHFASRLATERLAACVNILPIRSVYRWQGAVENSDERQLLIKTTTARLSDLAIRIKALHPYEVPEFVVLPISQGSASYLSWLTDSTKP